MRKRRLWITGQIMRDCWIKALHYKDEHSDEAWEKFVLNLKIVSLCREYILR